MSVRFDTPLAVPAPVKTVRKRTDTGSQTIWLNEPIDLRTAVERAHGRASAASPSGAAPVDPLQILRLLHATESSSG